jgi:flagellar protein FliL
LRFSDRLRAFLTAAGAVMATNEAQSDIDDDEENVAGKRKLPLKLIAMAAGGFVALCALGFGTYHFLFSGRSEQASATAAVVKPPAFLDMPEVLVNLSTAGGTERTQYLKVRVVLELPDQEMAAQIQPVMPRLMDTFQTYLRELRPTDLDGSAGLYRLKEELTRRVNSAIAPSRINAVLFKEIVVQ